ncbi:hypothetical protein GEMRC1_007023 [Eukaryota sp. GEM-RC1]
MSFTDLIINGQFTEAQMVLLSNTPTFSSDEELASAIVAFISFLNNPSKPHDPSVASIKSLNSTASTISPLSIANYHSPSSLFDFFTSSSHSSCLLYFPSSSSSQVDSSQDSSQVRRTKRLSKRTNLERPLKISKTSLEGDVIPKKVISTVELIVDVFDLPDSFEEDSQSFLTQDDFFDGSQFCEFDDVYHGKSLLLAMLSFINHSIWKAMEKRSSLGRKCLGAILTVIDGFLDCHHSVIDLLVFEFPVTGLMLSDCAVISLLSDFSTTEFKNLKNLAKFTEIPFKIFQNYHAFDGKTDCPFSKLRLMLSVGLTFVFHPTNLNILNILNNLSQLDNDKLEFLPHFSLISGYTGKQVVELLSYFSKFNSTSIKSLSSSILLFLAQLSPDNAPDYSILCKFFSLFFNYPPSELLSFFHDSLGNLSRPMIRNQVLIDFVCCFSLIFQPSSSEALSVLPVGQSFIPNFKNFKNSKYLTQWLGFSLYNFAAERTDNWISLISKFSQLFCFLLPTLGPKNRLSLLT